MSDVKIRTKKGVWTLKKWRPAWLGYMLLLIGAAVGSAMILAYILWGISDVMSRVVYFMCWALGWV